MQSERNALLARVCVINNVPGARIARRRGPAETWSPGPSWSSPCTTLVPSSCFSPIRFLDTYRLLFLFSLPRRRAFLSVPLTDKTDQCRPSSDPFLATCRNRRVSGAVDRTIASRLAPGSSQMREDRWGTTGPVAAPQGARRDEKKVRCCVRSSSYRSPPLPPSLSSQSSPFTFSCSALEDNETSR